MIRITAQRAATPAPSTRQREWEEEQTRWEAKLRRQAAVVPAPPPPRRSRRALPLTAAATRWDLLLVPRRMPALEGTGRQDLVCGKCGETVGAGISIAGARTIHPEGKRLLLRCLCGALNALDERRPGDQ